MEERRKTKAPAEARRGRPLPKGLGAVRFEILRRTGSGTERSGKSIVRRVFVFRKMFFTSNQLKRYLRANILIL